MFIKAFAATEAFSAQPDLVERFLRPLVKQLSSTSNHVLLQPEGPFGLPDVVEMEEAFNFSTSDTFSELRDQIQNKGLTHGIHLGMKYGFIMKRRSEMATLVEYAVQVCVMPP